MSRRGLTGLSSWNRRLVAVGVFAWCLITTFPLYWVVVTAFKTPPGVVGGPTYIPFVDFTPTLEPFIDLYQGVRGEFFRTFLNSTIVGLSAAAIATAIGAMAAYALVRFEFKVRFGAGLIFFLLALGAYLLFNNTLGFTRPQALLLAFPIALVAAIIANRLPLPGPILGNEDILFWFVSQRMFPPIVTAFALYLLYSEIGRLGFQLVDSYLGLTLCYVAFSLPIVVWLMRDFFEAIPIEVEEAAMVDNVPSWRIFLGIVVPMSMNGLLATFMITLAFVWNEFLFALFLTNSRWQTLPILVAGQNSQRGDEWWAISAAALVAIVPMMIMAGLLSRMMRSGLLLGAIKQQKSSREDWTMLRRTFLMLTTSLAMACAASQAHAACSPDYSGVTLTVATQTGPYIASALKLGADEWTKKTCGKVNVVEFPWSELYPKIVTSLTSSDATFDLVSFAPAWLPDFVPYLSEMPKDMQSGKDWDDIEPAYRERLMVWEGKIYSQSMDGDVHTYTYRTDLFSDPKEKDAFKAKYGYDLAPPKTWKQYLDIAEFFQRPDKGLWGTAEAFRRGGQQFWFFFSHAAAYTNNPNYPGAMFFDPETMDAQINNPGWVKGLEEYIRASKLGPPNALNFSFGEVNAAVAGGQVAESIGWGDTGVIAADPKQSKISGKVGSAVLPGSDEIWNAKTKKWDKFPAVLPAPFMAFGGWQVGVPNAGKNQKAAWDFVKTLTSPEVSGQAAITGGTGVNPYRKSHTANLELWSKIFSPAEAKEYLGAQAESINGKNVALDMRLPGYFSYTEVVEIELGKALAGQTTPQAALDAIAKEWNRLTDEFGRAKQLAAYRAAMGLPPKK